MGENGKRSLKIDFDSKIRKKQATDNDGKGGDELVVYRILCPSGLLGGVIGKSGKIIKTIRQESKAKINVVDPFPGCSERVLTIYCYVKEKEDIPDDVELNRSPLCPAQDALLKVHAAILRVTEKDDLEKGEKIQCRIIVPISQSASIIGKSGVTIKKLRNKTNANISINSKNIGDPTQSCAYDFDNFVSITGDGDAVMNALFAVSSIMYKFPPREDISLATNVPDLVPSVIIPSEVPIYHSRGFYPSVVDPVLAPRSVPSILGSAHAADVTSHGGPTSGSWPVFSGYGEAPRSEELVVRILCPPERIGRVIGKGGSSIKSLRQDSGANIEVDDKKDGRSQCVITVKSTESTEDMKSVAVDAIILLQGKINDDSEESVSFRLLVPSKCVGCVIGKSGAIINEIRKKTKANIQINVADKIEGIESGFQLVETTGSFESVRDSLVQMILRLRDDALKERDVHPRNVVAPPDPIFTSGSGLSLPTSVLPSLAPPRTDPGSGLGLLSSSSLYGYRSLSQDDNSYGPLPSYTSSLYGSAPSSTSTLEMLIPAGSVGRVMGKGGANIQVLCKLSGATIEISESKSFRGDRMAHITGTHDQKASAEKLIQAFILAL